MSKKSKRSDCTNNMKNNSTDCKNQINNPMTSDDCYSNQNSSQVSNSRARKTSKNNYSDCK